MKFYSSILLRSFAIVVMGFFLVSCTNNVLTIPASEYSEKIVGTWQGTVGNMKETMSIHSDGTFICRLHPRGFISNMIDPTVPGTIQGMWKITGSMISMDVTSSKNERLEDASTTSMIVSFKEGELTLKSDHGENSLFMKVGVL